MKLQEFMNMGNRTIIGQARKIERTWKFQPIKQEDMNWLVRLSRDGWFVNQLYRQSRKMNHKSPLQTDHVWLNDAGTCASAYIILNKVQGQIKRKSAKIG